MNIHASHPGLVRHSTRPHVHVHCDLRALEETGPFVISRGSGVYVFDQHGNRYIDGIAGMWCASLGYSEMRLVEAAHRQLSTLPYCAVFGTRSSDVSEQLAEELVSIAPPHLSKVLFMNSGSEANDTALKIVHYYNNARGQPGRLRIITHERAYHGSTIGSAAATAFPHMHRGFGLDLASFVRTTAPDFYRNAEPGEDEAAFAKRLATSLETAIQKLGPETIAAMILEPVMGAGGVVVPPADYLNRVEAVLRKYDIILIADEIITGFCRTGRMFGSQTFAFAPDILTVAKGLSSGYQPISAVLMSQPIYEIVADESHRIGTFGHGVTYSAHPVAAAVALEALRIYQERDIAAGVRQLSPHFLGRLSDFCGDALVGDVRGVGLLGAIELVEDCATRAKFDPQLGVASELVRRAQSRGVLLRALGGDVVVFCPPLVSTPEEIDMIVNGFAAALNETRAWLAGRS